MTRIRVALHAMDRTGPPMLGLALVRWLRSSCPDVAVDIVALRGGALAEDFVAHADARVLLEASEYWDEQSPDSPRVQEIRQRLSDLPPVDVVVLVSISAGAVLPFLDPVDVPIATWVVEQEEQFPPGVVEATTCWLAGSEGTREELSRRLPNGVSIALAPEFVESIAVGAGQRSERRRSLGVSPSDMLVMGVGIGTFRKAPDLFLEVALAIARIDPAGMQFVWVGGEADPLVPKLVGEVERLDLSNVRFIPGVADIAGTIAAADLLLHPARFDSFPLVCLHAAVVGVPVVAFAGVGGVPEMFGSAFVGAEFPDIEMLARQIVSLRDEARRQAVSRSQQLAAQRFVSSQCAPIVYRHLVDAACGTAAGAPS